jgi:hypothetical protein
MRQAVVWVTPRSRASAVLLIDVGWETTSRSAISQVRSGSFELPKTVPVLTVNLRRHDLQRQLPDSSPFVRTSYPPQAGQKAPSGQRSAWKKDAAVSSSGNALSAHLRRHSLRVRTSYPPIRSSSWANMYIEFRHGIVGYGQPA